MCMLSLCSDKNIHVHVSITCTSFWIMTSNLWFPLRANYSIIGVGICIRLEGPKDRSTWSGCGLFLPSWPHLLRTMPIFASTRLCDMWGNRFLGYRTSSKSYYLAIYSWSFVSWQWLSQACEISVDRLYLVLSSEQSVRSFRGWAWPGPPYSYAYEHFIENTNISDYDFRPMPGIKRKIIHELCVHYGCTSLSHGTEPDRFVRVNVER